MVSLVKEKMPSTNSTCETHELCGTQCCSLVRPHLNWRLVLVRVLLGLQKLFGSARHSISGEVPACQGSSPLCLKFLVLSHFQLSVVRPGLVVFEDSPYNVCTNWRTSISKLTWWTGPRLKWLTTVALTAGWVTGKFCWWASSNNLWMIFCLKKLMILVWKASILAKKKRSCDLNLVPTQPLGGRKSARARLVTQYLREIDLKGQNYVCRWFLQNIIEISKWPLRPAPPGGGGVWCDVTWPEFVTTTTRWCDMLQ